MERGIIEAPLYDHLGEEKGRRRLPPGIFLREIHEPSIHQAVRAYMTNRRRGTASTKNRSTVSGGGRKPWKQKGTGRARAGSIRSPLWRHGAVAFGPKPKEYRMGLPKRIKQLALYSALSQKARDEAIKVFEYFDFPAPKTRDMVGILGKVGVAGKKTLILTEGTKKEVYLSARNIPKVSIHPFKDISAVEILHADVLLMEDGVVEMLESAEGAE